jgi:hypothetical protein
MINTLRPYLELLYFITGGPVLAIFAFLALKQITVAKQNARTASQREAYRIAAEQVKSYANEVVPLLNELDGLIKEKSIEIFSNAEIVVEDSGVRVKNKWSDGDLDKLVEIAPTLVTALNRLEVFALFFTSRVASEQVAYSSIGATYVRSVKKLLPSFIGLANQNNYENILKLFLLWHQRREAERLELEKAEIQKRLRKIEGKKIEAIGTNEQ